MATTLRRVLEHVESQAGAVSLAQMARDLDVPRPLLQEMIDYWVRRGRLREAGAVNCGTCGSASMCPAATFVLRRYEPVSSSDTEAAVCACCGPAIRE
jgi:hypothetical protein